MASDLKRNLMKGRPLAVNAAGIARYQAALQAMVRRMTAEYEREISAFMGAPVSEEYFAQDQVFDKSQKTAFDASIAAQAKILMAALAKKFENLFNINAPKLADKMTDDAEESSGRSLSISLKELSGGLTLDTDIFSAELKEILKATITENVSLIKSIGEQYHKQVEGAFMRSITSGQGAQQLLPFLQKYKGITLKRAKFIADDQFRKAYNSINRARMQKIGMKQFEWLHTAGSQHPRKLHVRMSGKVYSFSKPPVIDTNTGERGFPGQLPNCRCTMIPVIKFD